MESKIEIRIDAEININGKISKCILTNDSLHSWEQFGLSKEELFKRVSIMEQLQKTLYENCFYEDRKNLEQQDWNKLEEDYERQREEIYTNPIIDGEEITK